MSTSPQPVAPTADATSDDRATIGFAADAPTIGQPSPDGSPVAGHRPARSVAANVASLASSQMITWSLSLLAMLFVPRFLGPEAIGYTVVATSVASLVAVVLCLPPRDYLVRAMVADRTRAPRIITTALLLRLAVVPLMLAAVTVYARVADLHGTALAVLYVVAVTTMATMLLEVAVATFQAFEDMQYIAYVEVANKALQYLGSILLVLLGFGVVAVTGLALVVTAVLVPVALFWVRRVVRVPVRPARPRPMMAAGLPYWTSAMFFMAYLWADGFMLGILAPPEVVGWYGAATRLFTTLMFVAVIVSTASLPRMIAAFAGGGRAALAAAARRPFEAVVVIGLPIAVGLATTADSIVPLVYGDEFLGAVPALAVLAGCVPLMYLNIMINQLFVASGRPLLMGWTLGGATLVNVSLNLVLIPFTQRRWGDGAVGAATSLLLTELFVVTVGTLVIGRIMLTRPTLNRLGRAALASVGMGVVVVLADPLPLAIQVLLGVVVVAALLLVLRVVTEDEKDMARRQVERVTARVRRTAPPAAEGGEL